jgi:hypothetical protein
MKNTVNSIYIFSEEYPIEALRAIVLNADESKPYMMNALEEVINKPDKALSEDYFIHLYALAFLGETKSIDAFQVIQRFLSIPDEYLNPLLGDFSEGYMDHVIYHTFNGDEKWIHQYIRDKSVNEFIRNTILKGYAAYLIHRLRDKQKLILFLKDLIKDKQQDMMSFVVAVVVDFHLIELIRDVYDLYEENLIEYSFFGNFDSVVDAMFDYKFESEIHHDMSLVDSFKNWYCFKKVEENDKDYSNDFLNHMIKKEPVEKSSKIKRNDPCPCGSNKKYKKCCLNKSDEEDFITEDYAKWMKNYPVKVTTENQLSLVDLFDGDSIKIDELLYLALHHRDIPMWIKRDHNEEERKKLIYLKKAKALLDDKMKKESLNDYETYDEKYMIHYKVKDWIDLA